MSAAYQNLFDYMYDEYGVILLPNEMQEIVRRVKLDEEQDNCNLPHVVGRSEQLPCEHEEKTMQGNGFTYVICSKCGVDL